MSTTVSTLTLIWQRLLRRAPIGCDESFFDIGGTDELADLLFQEIQQAYGRKLPSALIGRAPTIAALAQLLDQSDIPRFSPFIQIKEGTAQPPIFIAHGLRGTVEFFKLAQYLRTDHPVYGIQARGIDGMAEPFDRVEDMAQFYLEELSGQFPQGSGILIGYSFGGLVAFEMAQRLAASGRPPALLVLLDTYPHPRYLPRDHRMRLFLQRVRHHSAAVRRMPLTSGLSYLARGFQRKLHIAETLTERDAAPAADSLSFAEVAVRVNEKAYRAYMNYRPRFYPGKINLVLAETKSFFPGDPHIVWGPLSAGLDVEVITGNHLNIVTTEFEGLAAVLTRQIVQATTGK